MLLVTCFPDIFASEVFVNLMVLQSAIIPAVAAQMDTPWTAAVETISKST